MKLLFPTDFSLQANNALEVALNLAAAHRAELHIFHTVETTVGWARTEMVSASTSRLPPKSREALFPEMQRKIAAAKTALNKTAERALRLGINAKTHLGFDLGHKDIVKLAEDLKVDAIIMGTFGKSGKKKVFIGSNTIHVVRQAKCPVITINKAFKPPFLKDVLLVSEFESGLRDLRLGQLVTFLKSLGANIQLGFINTPFKFEISAKSDAKLKEAARHFGLNEDAIHVHNHEFVEDGILALASKLGNPSIALTTRGIGGLRKIFTFSVAEFLIKEAPGPVITAL
jgi:nucleotide-binding universal stress UspA family protein